MPFNSILLLMNTILLSVAWVVCMFKFFQILPMIAKVSVAVYKKFTVQT